MYNVCYLTLSFSNQYLYCADLYDRNCKVFAKVLLIELDNPWHGRHNLEIVGFDELLSGKHATFSDVYLAKYKCYFL